MKINGIETAMTVNEAQHATIATKTIEGWKLRVFGDESPEQLPQMSKRAPNGVSTLWIDICQDGSLLKKN